MGKNRRAVVAAVAILLAVVAGIAAFTYVNGADQRAQKNEDLVEVFVAASDIPKGTSGAQASALIAKQEIRRANRPDTALPNTASIANQVAAGDIPKGQFILTSAFVDQTKATPSLADLGSGMEAITVSVDDVKGVAGFIQPGDRVNVLQYAKLRKASDGKTDPSIPESYSAYVAQNVRVLAVGHQAVNSVPTTTAPGSAPAPAQGVGLLTLEVNPTQAERIVMAEQGAIYLSLVPKGYKPAAVAPVVDVVNLGVALVPPSNLVG
ncbi:MAG: Flp pilus assembly protein CpaB [Acidimicrobiia bacterium]